MGTGRAEGLIASETANNGLTGGALIPLVSLGIPGDSTTAVLIGAFTLQGVQLGPLFINSQPETWNSMLSSLIFSNIAMFLLMFFAIKYFAKVVFVPKFILYPIIIVMCTVGAYAINYGVMFDVWTLLIFGPPCMDRRQVQTADSSAVDWFHPGKTVGNLLCEKSGIL